MNGILTHATSVSPTTATTTAIELTAAQVAETNAAIYAKANAKERNRSLVMRNINWPALLRSTPL